MARRESPFLHPMPAQPSSHQVLKWGPSNKPVSSSECRALQPQELEALHRPPTPKRRMTSRLSVLKSSHSRLATWYVTRLASLLSHLVVLTPLLQRLAQSARAKDLALRQVTEGSARVWSLQGDLDNEREVNKGLMDRVADLTNQLNAEKQRNQGDNPSVCCCYFDFSK